MSKVKTEKEGSALCLVLKRNRTKSFVFYSFMLILTVIWLVLRINESTQTELLVYGFVALIFFLAIIFNIILIMEITYEIDESTIYCRSRFLPNEIVEAKNLVAVEYGQDGKSLIISYNRPEYNVVNILEDVEERDEKTGMWFFYINNKDINKPIAELKFLIQVLIDRNR